ncbi:copper transporter [Photobacterium kishitanii]|uniref:TolC family protein n=2 Tax=Photobacterium kishitanii TaxID=318456 RepID=A0AAX0YV72_9GAMM|nr:copper transporter [Photobacterium kishitanii]KJG58014.1 copper transporter [Photobacterium kishitanii]KJG63735.1 copper transporter [Photobacterium kishitanii]KJG66772.1 copper transporter [Photobacterium kishitanii]PSV15355.1 TolC family protein [Photobacterium kishitanii]
MNVTTSMLALTISAVAIMPSALFATPTTASVEQTSPQQLAQLITRALKSDANIAQIKAQQHAMLETSSGANSLPDPKLKLGIGGLPTDSFSVNKDPMTTLSIGLMQQFDRGNTLDLQQQKGNIQAHAIGIQQAVRELDITTKITQLWLELGYQQYTYRTLQRNHRLITELANVTSTNYGIGSGEAQDLLQVKLQLVKIEDKLQANQQIQRRIMAQLSEWLGADWLTNQVMIQTSNQLPWQRLNKLMPRLTATTQHYPLLKNHPMVQIANSTISANETQVAITQQAYKPQFGIEVMYASRQANAMSGKPASDLVSAYLTMDLPLFTDNRQDHHAAAAQYQVGAAKSQRDLLLNQMNAKVNALLVEQDNLRQRLARYKNTLLNQAKARTQAVERGYQNNTAQFNNVIAAATDELTLDIEQARITTDLNITNANLAALVNGFDIQPLSLQLQHSTINK